MIERIRIRNFKSLQDVTVDLDPLTVLIGRSGSGKTNFINAIRFLRSLLREGDNFLKNQQKQWNQIVSASLNEPTIHFEIHFTVPSYDESFVYILQVGKAEKDESIRIRQESLSVGESKVFNAVWGIHKLQHENRQYAGLGWESIPKVMDIPPLEGRSNGAALLAAFPALEETVVAHVALTQGIGCYDFPGDVFQSSGNQQSDRDSGMDDNGTNYLETMREIVRNLNDLSVRKRMIAALRTISPNLASIELNDHRNPTSAVVSHEFEDSRKLGLQLAQESEGFRRFFAHLLAMNQVPPKLSLFFEEPEKGIYPGGLEVLAKELLAVSERGQSQIVFTTHSPGLLDWFEPKRLRVVEISGNATMIGPISEEQSAAVRQDLLSAGELLTTDPARLTN